ncbi:MAG TPA: RNase adaptor protein RapZ, partial [Acidiferrobacteraceae bacterium]|nr:RNase adaptor protein RapZ [Acidiferrobacteraceae bacterium]HEX19346.1 RNase adaptor protein RapZ [Acidiferrobacteraceae bacterium]
NFAKEVDTPGMTLLLESFGFKHGTPLDADFVFDIRCLPNPHWQAELRKYTGLDDPVIRFLQSHEEVQDMAEHIASFLNKWIPKFEAEHRSYMTIAIGCTGGQHRSVYVVEKLAKVFKNMDMNIQIRHRELP